MTHWIVCTTDKRGDMWSVHETLEEAFEVYDDELRHQVVGASAVVLCAVYQSSDYDTHPALDAWAAGTVASMSEWTCEGCLDLVPDGAGHYINDMRACADCANKLEQAAP
jgi:hypothetical protein